jgi:hypothetical protein
VTPLFRKWARRSSAEVTYYCRTRWVPASVKQCWQGAAAQQQGHNFNLHFDRFNFLLSADVERD